ncbi:MAG: EamA/RhaT family transporter [Bacteroidetes bacterium]|nr:EamA/RhaT family transporter [Bacteroidota bacterium]
MLIYLLLSILSSTFLLIILKSFIRWKVETLHGIIFNYWVAALLSFSIAPAHNTAQLPSLLNMWYVSLFIGFLFIVVFYITAKTTQISGVAVASVASKMSMIIPISAGLFLYNESMGLQKLIGILIAIPAVILASNSGSISNTKSFNLKQIGLPLLLFFGAGLVDTAIKFTQHQFMNDDNRQVVIMSIFASAGIFGILRLIFEIAILKKQVSLRSVGGGVVLGVTNYLSLYFLLKCLESPDTESSTVFAYVNVGVVVTSFFAGILLFQ